MATYYFLASYAFTYPQVNASLFGNMVFDKKDRITTIEDIRQLERQLGQEIAEGTGSRIPTVTIISFQLLYVDEP